MSQNTKNQKGKNVILIQNASERGLQNEVALKYSRNSSQASQFMNFPSNGFGRQSSMGANLFKTFNTSQKPHEEPVMTVMEAKLSQAQIYAQECLQYEKYHFDGRIKLIIHRMAIKAYQNFKDKNQHEFLSFSIQKLLGIISKKLLLNRFELLFLQYVFEQTKWKIDIQCIARHSYQFASYAHLSEADGINQAIKKLEIYLLYCSFYSKKSLNEFPTDNKFNGYLKSLCIKFKEYFQEWTQQSNVSNIKINPKILNNIFKRLTFYSGRDQQEIQNYCLLVQQIIQISPAYNAEKSAKKRKTSKPKKEEIKEEIKEDHSEMILGQVAQYSEQLQDLSMRNKKQTSYLSNVDGLEPQDYINRNTRRMV